MLLLLMSVPERYVRFFFYFWIHFYDGWMEATDRDRRMSKKGRV